MVTDAAGPAARAETAACEQLRSFGAQAGLRAALVTIERVHGDAYILVGATSQRIRGTDSSVGWTVRCENAVQLAGGFDSPEVAGRALAQEVTEPQGRWDGDDAADIRYVGRAGVVFTTLARNHGFDARRTARILRLSDEPWPSPISADPAQAAAASAAIVTGDAKVTYNGSYTASTARRAREARFWQDGAVTGPGCPACGENEFEDGFIDDAVRGSVRWFAGRMTIGMFGSAKRSGPRRVVRALRCRACSRLELFADPDD